MSTITVSKCARSTGGSSAPTTSEVANAIGTIVPEIAAETSSATVARDADSAAVTVTEGTTVDIPKDPADPIVLDTADDLPLAIRIDSIGSAHDAARAADGTVVYQGTDEQASTAVQATAEGGVRFLTVIAGPDAPTDYGFTMDLPAGGRIEAAEDGGFTIVDGAGEVAVTVAGPWAKDANDQSIPVF